MTEVPKLVAAGAIALSATSLGLATATSAGAGAAATLPQRLTLTFKNAGGKDLPTRVAATGPIAGVGSESQTGRRTRTTEISTATLHLPKGDVRVVFTERQTVKLDLAACKGKVGGGGTFVIHGGTRAYENARGNGTFTDHGAIVGQRDSAGHCLGPKAPPASTTITIVATGTASLNVK